MNNCRMYDHLRGVTDDDDISPRNLRFVAGVHELFLPGAVPGQPCSTKANNRGSHISASSRRQQFIAEKTETSVVLMDPLRLLYAVLRGELIE